MTEIVAIEWRFSPKNYFEETLEFSCGEAVITIADGKIEARMAAHVFDADPAVRQSLHDHLNDRFLGVQLLTHKPYTLTRAHTTRVRPDGRRDITVELDTGIFVMAGCDVDFQVTDKDGNIVADSRRDRIDRKTNLAALVSRYRSSDAVLASMLRSHDAAVRDPDNELVHLYEIREALGTRFGGDSAVRGALSIGSTAWSRFGRLCNEQPLRQGRHRGKSGGPLRDASEGELRDAREITRAMIEAYLRHLDAPSAA